MLKVAISSIYRNINYGSALQAVALQQIIRRFGAECYHIIYPRSDFTTEAWLKRVLRPAIRSFRAKFNRDLRRINRFDKFRKMYLRELPLPVVLEGVHMDVYVCGSDQIWAPNQFNPYYFLDFVDKSKKKIAYAPSIGLPCIPAELCNEYVRLISSIPYLSVRGDEDAKLLKMQFGIDAESVLDPTLLLSANDWSKYISRSRVCKVDYIFCYMLGDERRHIDAISKFASERNLRAVVVAPHLKNADCQGVDVCRDLGPAEWLRAIKDARYVITDSYHGMLFSIIFRKEFCEILRFSDDDPICQNSRVVSIVNQFNLNSRVLPFGCFEIAWPHEQINYEAVYRILDEEKQQSMVFLRNALTEAMESKV